MWGYDIDAAGDLVLYLTDSDDYAIGMYRQALKMSEHGELYLDGIDSETARYAYDPEKFHWMGIDDDTRIDCAAGFPYDPGTSRRFVVDWRMLHAGMETPTTSGVKCCPYAGGVICRRKRPADTKAGPGYFLTVRFKRVCGA